LIHNKLALDQRRY